MVKLLEKQQQNSIVARKTMNRIDKTRHQLLWQIPWTDNTDRQSQETTCIVVLEEILESLGITKEYTDRDQAEKRLCQDATRTI